MRAMIFLVGVLLCACAEDGEKECEAAGGECRLPGGDCVAIPDKDCTNGETHPGGSMCCRHCPDGGKLNDAGTACD